MDDIFQVITDDLVNLAAGRHMPCRLDGKPWGKMDSQRRKVSGQSLRIAGVLTVCCPDWACLKSVFRCPQHNEKEGFCFKCRATPSDLRDVGEFAPWKQQANRLTHWQCLEKMLMFGKGLNPLMGAPGMRIGAVFRLDWMHIGDLGVTADFMGLVFHLMLPHLEGSTLDARISTLFKMILTYYQSKPKHVEARLDNLKAGMIYPRGRVAKSPKLNAQAAETRSLVDFCVDASAEVLTDHVPIERMAKDAALHLQSCYAALSEDCIFHADTLAEHSRKFSLLCVAMEALSPTWHVKPKLHMFQEMCEMDMPGRPAYVWNYRDEDFGGSMATLARMAGGHSTPWTTGHNALCRFVAKHAVPKIK